MVPPGRARSLIVMLNGRLCRAARAAISPFDRGLLYGDGIYETIRAYGGRPFRLGAHLDRLRASAARLGLRLPGGGVPLTAAVDRVLAANRLREARIRITVTRGAAGPDPVAPAGLVPTVLVFASPYAPPPPADYRDGVRAVITRVIRNDRRAVDPAIKATSLLNNLLAAREAGAQGAREAILLNGRGEVAESASANVFWVRRGTLYTPSLEVGILAGVTRAVVLDLARRLGVPVRAGRFRPAALSGADEAFVSASTIEVLPLAALGRRRYPPRRPVTRALQTAYRVTVEDDTRRPGSLP
jgi:branched-chain amino acid aminotransferase